MLYFLSLYISTYTLYICFCICLFVFVYLTSALQKEISAQAKLSNTQESSALAKLRPIRRSSGKKSFEKYKKAELCQRADQSDRADKELWLSRVHQAQQAQLERKARPWCNLLLREPLFVRQPSQQVRSLRLRPPHLIGLELQKPRNSLKLPKSR